MLHDHKSQNRTDGGGNLTQHKHLVTATERYHLIQQQGQVLWLTGLSGSGKSTLAMACEKLLLKQHKVAFVLDGDHTRGGLCKDLGFTLEDRIENVRRVSHCAHLMAQAGVIVFVCLISPTQVSRNTAREICQLVPFSEIYLDIPLDICEQRDPKGLYKRARAGQIPNFTGIDSPYEIPTHPQLVIQSNQTLDESVKQLINYLNL